MNQIGKIVTTAVFLAAAGFASASSLEVSSDVNLGVSYVNHVSADPSERPALNTAGYLDPAFAKHQLPHEVFSQVVSRRVDRVIENDLSRQTGMAIASMNEAPTLVAPIELDIDLAI